MLSALTLIRLTWAIRRAAVSTLQRYLALRSSLHNEVTFVTSDVKPNSFLLRLGCELAHDLCLNVLNFHKVLPLARDQVIDLLM